MDEGIDFAAYFVKQIYLDNSVTILVMSQLYFCYCDTHWYYYWSFGAIWHLSASARLQVLISWPKHDPTL